MPESQYAERYTQYNLKGLRSRAAFVADAIGKPAPQHAGRFYIEAAIDQASILLGEPLIICVWLTNDTNDAVTIKYSPGDSIDSVNLKIGDEQGNLFPRISHFETDRDDAPVIIKPGQRLVQTINVFDDYGIAEPGKYRIEAHYQCDGEYLEPREDHRSFVSRPAWKGELSHEVGTVEIYEPTDDADRRALAATLEAGNRQIVSRQSPDRRYTSLFPYTDEKVLNEVLAESSQSRYALYARFSLALYKLKRHEETHNDDFARQALERMREIDLDECGPLIREEILFAMIDAQQRLKSGSQVIKQLQMELGAEPICVPAPKP